MKCYFFIQKKIIYNVFFQHKKKLNFNLKCNIKTESDFLLLVVSGKSILDLVMKA